MASSSGNSSGSPQLLQSSGSEEDMHTLMDERKRKRMQSNRESARRSRQRKQKLLDDLTAQVTELRKENNQILTSINITTQHYLNIEADNSVLRAQMAELKQRFDSLNEILNFINCSNGVFENDGIQTGVDSFMSDPLSLPAVNHPIMASADIFPH